MEKCSKCNTASDFFVKYRPYGESMGEIIGLCVLCDRAFDIRGELLKEFMKDDFGTFPISPITRNIISARKARADGKGPWDQPTV